MPGGRGTIEQVAEKVTAAYKLVDNAGLDNDSKEMALCTISQMLIRSIDPGTYELDFYSDYKH